MPDSLQFTRCLEKTSERKERKGEEGRGKREEKRVAQIGYLK